MLIYARPLILPLPPSHYAFTLPPFLNIKFKVVRYYDSASWLPSKCALDPFSLLLASKEGMNALLSVGRRFCAECALHSCAG